ncbi:terminase large subunit domain-containing protein [Enemella evansiae]|nr:terminase large subunit [Enemella evansiae]
MRGRLRYRQVVISMGRQNGKSLLGGGFALYGLTQHVPAPSVIGVATSVEQANVVYRRVHYAVTNDPLLDDRLKASGTRGIRWRDGRGEYLVKPSLAEGLQSVPVTLGIADELHLMKAPMWYSVVNGQRAQTDGLLVGITTAGDELSTLLKDLYTRGRTAAASAADDERFGFFLWEAPEKPNLDSDSDCMAANPSIACGRVDLATVRADVRKLPADDRERYFFNRFVLVAGGWADMTRWAATETDATVKGRPDLVFGIARTDSWSAVSIVAATKLEDGTVTTEVVAQVARLDSDQLVTVCTALAADTAGDPIFALDTSLGTVADKLTEAGVTVVSVTAGDALEATPAWWAAVDNQTVKHVPNPLLTRQIPMSKRAKRDTGWRLSPTDSTDVDSVHATIWAHHAAHTRPAPGELQLW